MMGGETSTLFFVLQHLSKYHISIGIAVLNRWISSNRKPWQEAKNSSRFVVFEKITSIVKNNDSRIKVRGLSHFFFFMKKRFCNGNQFAVERSSGERIEFERKKKRKKKEKVTERSRERERERERERAKLRLNNVSK